MMRIPFFSFAPQHAPIREEVLAAVAQVYDSQWFVLGNAVKTFEAAYADFSQTRHCIGVANGLDALHLSLRALGIGPGDEVLVPSNTYIATWLAASYLGATLVPVEPDPLTYNLTAAGVEAALTPRTRAILPVHLYGQACPMTDIMTVAQRHDLVVVEDNAQAQGAACQGQPTGSFGHLNATSFYPSKNLGALGDAGAITTNDEALAYQVRVLRNYGSQRKYYNETIGYNSRLDELHAAVLSAKLPYLAGWTAQRQQLAAWYDEALQDIIEVQGPVTAAGCTHVYHLYIIRTAQRDELQRHLAERGVETLIHYPVPPHLQQAYAHLGLRAGQFPIAESIAATALSLPLWPGMTQEQVHYVAAAIRSFFKSNSVHQ